MKIVLQAFLVYIAFISVTEKNVVIASKIPKEFLRSPDAESRGLWSALKALLLDKNEDEAEELFKEMDSTNRQTSRGLWTNFKQCLMDKDDSLSRGIWTNFKECLKDEDTADSRGLWSAFVALLSDKDEAEVEEIVNQMVNADSRWGFNLGFSWDKLVDTLIEDVDAAKAQAIKNELSSTNNAKSRAFWVPLLVSLLSDKDDAESRWGFSLGFSWDTLLEDLDEAKAEAIIKDFVSKSGNAESRGLWTNFKQCLLDKDDSLSRGIWSSFKECLKDEDDAETRTN